MIKALVFGFMVVIGGDPGIVSAEAVERVQAAKDQSRFILEPSGRPFVPWGFQL